MFIISYNRYNYIYDNKFKANVYLYYELPLLAKLKTKAVI